MTEKYIKPDREAIVRAMHAEVCCPCDPTGCDVAEVSENRYAHAVLALLPGRSEAEVLREAAGFFRDTLHDHGAAGVLDRLATEWGAS